MSAPVPPPPDPQLSRISAAAKALLGARDVKTEFGAVAVDLEGLIAALLLHRAQGDGAKAALIFNEMLVPGVERRIAYGVQRLQVLRKKT